MEKEIDSFPLSLHDMGQLCKHSILDLRVGQLFGSKVAFSVNDIHNIREGYIKSILKDSAMIATEEGTTLTIPWEELFLIPCKVIGDR